MQLSDWVENIVGKGEIAHYEQFLLFPQRFQKLCVVDASKWVSRWFLPLIGLKTLLEKEKMLLFPQYFQKPSLSGSLKLRIALHSKELSPLFIEYGLFPFKIAELRRNVKQQQKQTRILNLNIDRLFTYQSVSFVVQHGNIWHLEILEYGTSVIETEPSPLSWIIGGMQDLSTLWDKVTGLIRGSANILFEWWLPLRQDSFLAHHYQLFQ